MASAAVGERLSDEEFARLSAAQIVILGESHDNLVHHQNQAQLVDRLNPTALVFEMLTPTQAQSVTPDLVRDEAKLEQALEWTASGWPDFAMYFPIFTAAPDATIYGAAVPRARARASMEDGLIAAFGKDAARFGLHEDLPADQQAAREALQADVHCDALPEELLPAMVDIQRLRDARLAQTALEALDHAGAPVVVITGNGHARRDWGVPAAIAQARPDIVLVTLGQGENGSPRNGIFDMVLDAPAPARVDPCAALRAD